MATVDLFPDFKEFLKSLNSAGVEYLLLGGYAVAHYGYECVTKDIDVWIAVNETNVARRSAALQSFGGFTPESVAPSMFLEAGKVFAFGREPVRIDILTGPDGVDFAACYGRRHDVIMDGVKVPVISLTDLRANKLASGRTKDLADLEHLPTDADASRPVVGRRGRKRKPKGK